LEAGSIKISLAASSPGLFLILFGCILIAIPNLSAQTISTRDAASFFGGLTAPTTSPFDLLEAKTAYEKYIKEGQAEPTPIQIEEEND